MLVLLYAATGSLSLQQPSKTTVKISLAAYQGALAESTGVAVFTYRVSIAAGALCATQPLYTHMHYDSWSQYGTAVQLSEDGRVLAVGAPGAEDVNRNASVGAVYLYDVSIDKSMSTAQYVKQGTNNGVAGCHNGKDSNGNPCTLAPKDKVVHCKAGYTLLNAHGSKIMISEAGEQVMCTEPPTPFFAPLTSTISSSTPMGPSGYVASTLSPYTTLNPGLKSGISVPIGTANWAPAANIVSLATTGMPAPTNTANMVASSWTPSVSAYNGGLPAQVSAFSGSAAAALGYSFASALLGGGALPGIGSSGAGATATTLGLPYGAVITG
jgi:hypothetical protein